jgi:hypothetical protein
MYRGREDLQNQELINKEKTCPWHYGWSVILAVLVVITALFRYALPLRDGDIWFHMLYGRYFLENHTLIADHTIFSWTPSNNDTIYCTWLPDIFFYLLHQATGLPGLFAFRYLCMSTIILACFLFSRKLKIASHPLVWVICLIALLMSYTAAFVKPEIISFVLMVMMAWNWWHIRAAGEASWRHCYIFPLLMLVWVNSHGGFIFGAIFLVLIGAGELLNTWFSHGNALPSRWRKHLAWALVLAGFTPFVNPYGYRYPFQLFIDLLPTQENMSYLQKIASYTTTFKGVTPFHNFSIYADLAIFILIVLYVLNFRRKNIEWSSLLTNLVFAFLYTRFFRTTFFWAPVFAFSAISLLATTPVISLGGKYRKAVRGVFLAILLVLACYLAGDSFKKALYTPEPMQWMGFGISEGNPVEEGAYIKKYYPEARIGNLYDQGAYLLWLLWPDNLVFYDARQFPYRAWVDEFFSFMAGDNFEEFTQKYPVDLWCVNLNLPKVYQQFVRSLEWQLAFYDKNSAVFVKKELPLPAHVPTVGPAITQFKSPVAARAIFSFACNIQDWQTAGKVLAALDKFKGEVNKKQSIWAFNIYHGLRAYYARDYKDAATFLGAAHEGSDQPYYILTNCYLFLSGQAWQDGDDQGALALTHKAWNVSGGDIWSAYNAGVMVWYNEGRHHVSDGSIVGEDERNWQAYLRFFLKHAPQNSAYQASRDIAQRILAGTFQEQGRPELIMPPEPDLESDIS